MLARKTLSSSEGFQLQALPPTANALKYHSYRTYLQVQKIFENDAILSVKIMGRIHP